MEILEAMRHDWRGPDYDLLKRNCTHFSDEFCHRLGLGRVPKWVMNLSAAGVTVKGGAVSSFRWAVGKESCTSRP